MVKLNFILFLKFLFSAILFHFTAMPCLCDSSHTSASGRMSAHEHPDLSSIKNRIIPQSRFPLPVPSRYILPLSYAVTNSLPSGKDTRNRTDKALCMFFFRYAIQTGNTIYCIIHTERKYTFRKAGSKKGPASFIQNVFDINVCANICGIIRPNNNCNL